MSGAVASVRFEREWTARRAVGSDAMATDTAPTRRPPWGAVALTGIILMASFIGENATEAWLALHIERTLGAAPGEAEGVNAIQYLLQSRYLTGKTIALDGGRHLARAS